MIGRRLTTALLALGLASTAGAATLATPPLMHDFFEGDAFLLCSVRNVSSGPVTVTVDGLGFGVPQETATTTIAPGASYAMYAGGYGIACRFTITGSTKRVRAAAVFTDGNAYHHAIPAR